MGKYPKDRRGTAQDGHFVSIFALPPIPHYGGTRTCWILQHFRRAKSEWLVSIPAGPLGPGRMENCGGCNSTAAPSLAEHVIAGPSSAGRSGTGPYEMAGGFYVRRRGGSVTRPLGFRQDLRKDVGATLAVARRVPPHNLSPAATKALSKRGVSSPRLVSSQRQRKTRYRQSTELPAPLHRATSPLNWRPS